MDLTTVPEVDRSDGGQRVKTLRRKRNNDLTRKIRYSTKNSVGMCLC